MLSYKNLALEESYIKKNYEIFTNLYGGKLSSRQQPSASGNSGNGLETRQYPNSKLEQGKISKFFSSCEKIANECSNIDNRDNLLIAINAIKKINNNYSKNCLIALSKIVKLATCDFNVIPDKN